jgi:hypothetical protein
MSDFWYFADKNGKIGPVTFKELKASLATRQNTSDVFVWCKKFSDWVRADDVPELRSQTATSPPPALRSNVRRAKRREPSDTTNSQTKSVVMAVLAGLGLSILVAALNVMSEGLKPIDPYQIFNPAIIAHWVARIGFVPLIFVSVAIALSFRKTPIWVSTLNFLGAVVGISLVTSIAVVTAAAVYPIKEFPFKAIGPDRDEFVKNAMSSCISNQQTTPKNWGVSQTIISDYCTCYANSLADITTKEDIKYQTEHGGFSPNAIAITTSSAEKCAQAVRNKVNPPRPQ